MSEIWAVLEHRNSVLDEQSGELLAEMLEVAQRQPAQPDVCAILLTSPDIPLPDLALIKAQGVARFYVLAHPRLDHYSTEAYVSALAWFIRQFRPLLVTCSATANGRDCMARLAARLHLPYAPGCLSIDVQDDALVTLRTMYDGRAYIQSSTTLQGRTALATFIPGVRGNPVARRDMAIRSGEQITMVTPTIDEAKEPGRIKHITIQAPSPEDVELEAAQRIVAGGRGVGREGFAQVAAFARLLGAAVGATRVATDRGWVEHARQIGATGRTVHPRLYIACGISGAAQHTSGMREAQTVIAINPDRTAPIFVLADLGLLGDANQVLPLAARLIDHD